MNCSRISLLLCAVSVAIAANPASAALRTWDGTRSLTLVEDDWSNDGVGGHWDAGGPAASGIETTKPTSLDDVFVPSGRTRVTGVEAANSLDIANTLGGGPGGGETSVSGTLLVGTSIDIGDTGWLVAHRVVTADSISSTGTVFLSNAANLTVTSGGTLGTLEATSGQNVAIEGGDLSATLFYFEDGVRLTFRAGNLTASNTSLRDEFGSGDPRLIVASGAAVTLQNVAGDPGMGLIKDGVGKLTLGGTNTYPGGTSIQGGTVLVNGTHVESSGGDYTFGEPLPFPPFLPFLWNPVTLGGVGNIIRNVDATGSSDGKRTTIAPGDPATLSGVGTLTIGSASSSKTMTFSLNSRLAIDIDGAAADQLAIFGDLRFTTVGLDELVFNVLSPPTLGSYTIVSYTGNQSDGGSPGFSNVSGVPAGYRVSYDNFNPTNGTIDLVQRAVIDPTAVPVNATVITGASTNINTTVLNNAMPDGDTLHQFTAAGSGEGVSGSFSGGALTPQASANDAVAIVFDSTGQPIGVNSRAVSFSSTDAGITMPVVAGYNVTVLSHSDAAFDNMSGRHLGALLGDGGNQLDVDFGTVLQSAGGGVLNSFFDVIATIVDADFTAGLDLDELTGLDDVAVLALSGLSSFSNLAPGSGQNYNIAFDTTVPGSFSATYEFKLSDQDLPGATAPMSELLILNVSGNVVTEPSSLVPEPASLTHLVVGALMLALRRRKQLPGGRRAWGPELGR